MQSNLASFVGKIIGKLASIDWTRPVSSLIIYNFKISDLLYNKFFQPKLYKIDSNSQSFVKLLDQDSLVSWCNKNIHFLFKIVKIVKNYIFNDSFDSQVRISLFINNSAALIHHLDNRQLFMPPFRLWYKQLGRP